MSRFHDLAETATNLASYYSHCWTPDASFDYETHEQWGRAWFTFGETRDVLLFKLSV